MACKACEGTGRVTVYKIVKRGDSWVRVKTKGLCEDCLGKALCPQCGGEMTEELAADSQRCDRCGFYYGG